MSAKSAARKPAAAKSPPKPAAKTAKPGGDYAFRRPDRHRRPGRGRGGGRLPVLAAGRARAALAAGTEPGRDRQVESLYNDIYVYRPSERLYVLSFGAERLRYTEFVVNPTDELDLPVYYTQSMTAGLAYAAGTRRAPRSSASAAAAPPGTTTRAVPTLEMTAVELDPEVARIADELFPSVTRTTSTSRSSTGACGSPGTSRRFDIIMVDAYRGPFVPFHLLTTEFYELVVGPSEPRRRRGAERRAARPCSSTAPSPPSGRLRPPRLLRGPGQHRHPRL